MERSIFLSIGIADLLLSYLLFTDQQYFSFAAMLSIFLIVILGFVMMLLSYHYESENGVKNKRNLMIFALLCLISLVLVIYEAGYDLEYIIVPSSEIVAVALAAVATPVFVAGLYLIHIAYMHQAKKGAENGRRYKLYALALVLLIILSAPLYLMQSYVVETTNWFGTDELAFNYYASTLFLQGSNPYNASMEPILKSYGLDPTLELNSTCECSYDYPALSFMLTLFSTIGGYPFNLLFATMILVAFVSFLLFKSSKWNVYALLPIAAWFFASFYIAPAPIGKYIAISLFLVIAYVYRAKTALAGIFLGLAASTNQISWIALPFFYVLTLRESGGKAAAKSMLVTAGIFLIANGYFIALSPHKTIGNMLSLFLVKLQFYGPSLIQLLATFFPVAYWSLTLTIIIIFIFTLLLFYLYTDTLKLLLAVVPPMLLFLSWRSIPSYVSAFIPLIVVVYYSEKGSAKDFLQSKRYMGYLTLLAFVLVASVLVYAHGLYTSANTLQIVHVYGTVQTNKTTGTYAISNIIVNVSNNANKTEAILFYLISRSPDELKYTPVNYNNSPPARSYTSYQLPFSLPDVNATTKLDVFVLSNDYIYGVQVNTTTAK